jgi:Cu(I)/Ag(I) efflux system membrane fusion protein
MQYVYAIGKYGLLICLVLFLTATACHTKQEKEQAVQKSKRQYTCPMHHEIIRDKPGSCPVCGMDLVPFGTEEDAIIDVDLNTLLRPTNTYALSTIPVVKMEEKEEQVSVEALGTVAYDTRAIGSVAANISGRIEKLYLRYTFQEVKKGQKLMDIYSPELLTAQQNLLFLLQHDPENHSFIEAAKEKLLLLGVSQEQLQEVIRTGKTIFTVSVYSNYSGHIHTAFNTPGSKPLESGPEITRDLQVKEGMYVQKGQAVFSVYNPDKLWALLNIYADNQDQLKRGDQVSMIAETAPGKTVSGQIDFIEPFFRDNSKTVTARMYFDNSHLHIPVGSQVKAQIHGKTVKARWLPKESVISLGLDKVVFRKEGDVFKAHKITTGMSYQNRIEIISGLSDTDEVAGNAQFLMDSESFIKIKG